MLSYPFSYFSSIIGWKRPFTNRRLLSWFQLLFTSIFLIALSMIPVALQNQRLSNYPLTTFVENAFDPLTDQVLADMATHIQIDNQQLTYTGSQATYTSKAGQVVLGHQKQVPTSKELTLYFDTDALHIRREETDLAIAYQAINQASLQDKKALTTAISEDWFQQNRPTISLFLILLSGGLLTINFLIVAFGASGFLYLTKRSRLFSFVTLKECYNFILNCLGLPTLIALILGLLGQNFTTMITTQNILFVLYLVIIFYKTHFRDQD